jgi:Cd2+/Zn2+-exporting ATPase
MSEPIGTKHVYRVQGLTCANCAAIFEKNVKDLPKVRDARVNFGASKITVYGEASIRELEQAGAFEGLKVFPEPKRREIRSEPFWKRASAATTVLSAIFLLAGWTIGENNPVSIAAFLLSILIGGYPLFIKGLKSLVRFHFNMNALMTIAIIGAAAIGEWGEGATVVFLFAVSEALEMFSMEKARQSIRSLMSAAPKEAVVRRGGQEMLINVNDMEIGDTMIVKPGQKIAMDGKIVKGRSTVNQAAITGESVPVAKSPGDEVFAGTINEEGLLEVEITKRAEDTTLSKIVYLVEEAQAEKAPSQAFVDRFAQYYTPAVMALAAGLAVIPPLWFGGAWNDWIYRGLALLVVGCPCALVISTPVAIVTAIGTAARNGVLIKGGVHLEETGSLTAMAFDKTGTLTKGAPAVTDFIRLQGPEKNELLAIAAAIEKWSPHPLAAAIVRKADEERAEPEAWEVEDVVSITGKGAKAVVNGELYYIGSPRLFEELQTIGDELAGQIEKLQEQGKTVMLLGTERQIFAVIAVADEVRQSGKEAIRKLHALGIRRTVMLTGDNESTAKAIASHVGISEVKAELLPQHKLEAIKELKQWNKVAMVGDGVNDAPALARATVGIAMGGAGTDTALETADIVLMADDLTKLPFTVKLSRRALKIIKQNILFSIAIKAAAVLIIFPGWLTLWMAIFADIGATLIVTLNAMRLLRTRAR